MALVSCRECEREVSTEASACPHCGADDPVPALPLSGKAPHGGQWDDWVRWELGKEKSAEEIAQVLAENGAHYESALEEVERQRRLKEARSRRRSRESRPRRAGDGVPAEKMLGFAGSALLLIGAFLPLVSLPMVGGVTYVRGGSGEGILIVIMALVAALLVAKDRFTGVAITGALASALMIFTFVNFQSRVANAQERMNSELAGNPFKGLADTMMQSVQLEWGWAVLILGVVCLFASSIVYSKNPSS